WYQCPDAEIRYHGPNAGIGTLAHRAPFLPSGESTSAVTGEELDSQGSCLARGTDREGYCRDRALSRVLSARLEDEYVSVPVSEGIFHVGWADLQHQRIAMQPNDSVAIVVVGVGARVGGQN